MKNPKPNEDPAYVLVVVDTEHASFEQKCSKLVRKGYAPAMRPE